MSVVYYCTDSLILHGDERMVWSTQSISKDLILSVQLNNDLVIIGQLLPRLCYLPQMLFQGI